MKPALYFLSCGLSGFLIGYFLAPIIGILVLPLGITTALILHWIYFK